MADDFAEFDDEFIVEGEEGPSNRPFILAVMGLVGVLLLALIVLGVYTTFFNNPAPGTDGEVVAAAVDSPEAQQATQISATNEAIEAQNEFVTQTLESRRLTDEAPTATPTDIPPTETPEPTATATEELEVAEESADGEDGVDEEGEEPNAEATSIFSDVNTVTPSASGAGGDDNSSDAGDSENVAEDNGDSSAANMEEGEDGTAAVADTTAAEETSSTAVEELPDTGGNLWVFIVVACSLMVVFVGARRLRTAE